MRRTGVNIQKRRTGITIGIAFFAIVIVVALIATRAGQPPARAVTAPSVTATIVVNPVLGDTFAPPPPNATPTLTAGQAWADFAQLNNFSNTAIPSGVTVQLGLVTVPVGPAGAPGTSGEATANGQAYVALNELAYGYSSPSLCPAPTNPNATTSPGTSCIAWDFLDAQTGQQIVSTWQVVS
jgi:hypothetical protein